MNNKPKQSPRHHSGQAGQALLMTVILLGGLMIGTTAVSAIALVYAVRSATLAGFSSQAIYAADAGLEWELYQYFVDESQVAPTFSNGATISTCSFVSEDILNANNSGVRSGVCGANNADPELTMRSVGIVGPQGKEVRRAFELLFKP